MISVFRHFMESGKLKRNNLNEWLEWTQVAKPLGGLGGPSQLKFQVTVPKTKFKSHKFLVVSKSAFKFDESLCFIFTLFFNLQYWFLAWQCSTFMNAHLVKFASKLVIDKTCIVWQREMNYILFSPSYLKVKWRPSCEGGLVIQVLGFFPLDLDEKEDFLHGE